MASTERAVSPVSSSGRILHVITGLGRGGAETALLRLLAHSAAKAFRHRVLSLTAGGSLRREVEAVTDEVADLGLRRGLPFPWDFPRMVVQARRRRPDLLVGWMYHGNVAASMIRPFMPGAVPVVWNVRHSADALKQEKLLTAGLIRGGRWLAPGTARIVFNSHHSARLHEALGYPREKFEVVANGFDCKLFRPRPEARRTLREELGVAAETRVVARIGRLHPVKDYPGLLEAAGRLGKDVHWLLVGPGLSQEPRELREAVHRAGLQGRCHFWGERQDLPEILPGLDLLCSSSLSEGFPNVVAEAMACAVPCAVTDVGSSAELVGETGLVVPPGDPASLAAALGTLLALPSEELRRLGTEARARIQERYAADVVYPLQVDLWRQCLARAAGSAA